MTTAKRIQALRPKLPAVLLLIFLAVITLYTSWFANYYLSGNSDDIVYPYLFEDFKFNDMTLPGQHSNILKFPLFVVQAILPYNFLTFTLIGIGLVLTTVIAWAYLLGRIFGKRYLFIICLSLASVLLGSIELNNQLYGTTIRNIEYPISLAFIIVIAQVSKNGIGETFIRRMLIGIVSILFAMTVAGDSFFLYTICGALFIMLAFFWSIRDSLKSKQPSSYYFLQATSLVAGVIILAIIMRLFVRVTNIASFNTDAAFLPHVLPLNHLSPSLSTAATQVVTLSGANIFGQTVKLSHSLVFLNFLILVVGLIGLIRILSDIGSTAKRQDVLKRLGFVRLFTLGSTAFAGVLAFALYVGSDQVVSESPAGIIASAGQERYLTLIPMLLVVGVVYIIWRNYSRNRAVVLGFPILILLIILANAVTIKNNHKLENGLRTDPIAIADVLQKNDIPVLVTGYWYAASTRFWSEDTITVAPIGNCNVQGPLINGRSSWYESSPSVKKSALVVGHTGIDAIYATCPDEELMAIYGKPSQVLPIKSANDLNLWVYKYDIRAKINRAN